MAGIDRHNKMEIFLHPRELKISIVPTNGSELYPLSIMRDTEEGMKVLFCLAPFAERREVAARMARSILREIKTEAETELKERPTVSRFLDPASHPLHPSRRLTFELIERIVADLRRYGVADTRLYEPPLVASEKA